MSTLVCVAPSEAVLERFGRPAGRWPRAERMRAADGRDLLAARQLTVALAGALTRESWTAADLRQHCAECGGADHGRPSLGRLEVGWSHAAGVVATVVSDEAAVAIDVQGVDDAEAVLEVLVDAAPAGSTGHDDPVSAWVVRETLVKLGLVSLGAAIGLSQGDVDALAGSLALSAAWCDRATTTCVGLGMIGKIAGAGSCNAEIVDFDSLTTQDLRSSD